MADRTVAVISDGDWVGSTAYHVGDQVDNDTHKIYKCITAGTSASSGGPTGTGSDITDGGAHWAYQATVDESYTSLNGALSGEDEGDLADLTTSYNGDANGGILTIDCYNFEDTTAADTGTGYTVSSSYYIKVQAHDSHSGTSGTISYRHAPTVSAYNGGFFVRAAYTRLIGLIFNSNLNNAESACVRTTVNYCLIEKCIFTPVNNGNTSSAFFIAGTGTNIRNCLIIRSTSGAYGIYDWGDSAPSTVIHNCTIIGCSTSVRAASGSSTFDCTNVGCSGFGTASFVGTGITQTTCSESSPTFVGSGNYHLSSSDTAWIGQGTDLSGSGVTTDIDGQTRPTGAGTWDIGADEYVASGGGVTMPIFFYYYMRQHVG